MISVLSMVVTQWSLSSLLSIHNDSCPPYFHMHQIWPSHWQNTIFFLFFLSIVKNIWSLSFLWLKHNDLCSPYCKKKQNNYLCPSFCWQTINISPLYWQYTLIIIHLIICTQWCLCFLLSQRNDLCHDYFWDTLIYVLPIIQTHYLCPSYCQNTIICVLPIVKTHFYLSFLLLNHNYLCSVLPIVKTKLSLSFLLLKHNDICPPYCQWPVVYILNVIHTQ